MTLHINELENKTFTQQTMQLQNFRERILENELSKVKETLSKNRSSR